MHSCTLKNHLLKLLLSVILNMQYTQYDSHILLKKKLYLIVVRTQHKIYCFNKF